MIQRTLRAIAGMAIMMAAIGCALSSPASAQVQVQFQIIHSFGALGDGEAPGGAMTIDSKGNLYGTAGGETGGACNGGIVYELTPSGHGQRTETILHCFAGPPSDGYEPIGVVIDSAGNLYGTTLFGGDGQYCPGDGCGTVFELSPGANGVWTESILYNFCSQPSCGDGIEPVVAPTLGPGGSLYGIASYAAYQLTPGSGGWTLNVLYTFCNEPGCNPTSSLTLYEGNLYGEGGIGHGVGDCLYQFGCGVVFELQPQPDGQWNEVLLWEFDEYGNNDGIGPEDGLTFHDGGLYGVTGAGGSNCVDAGGCGTVFELTRGSGNSINEKVLWSFGGDGGTQGVNPSGGVVFNKQGDLFGVTGLGGEGENGVVYGMKPQPNGTWEYAVLQAFGGADGVEPDSSLTIDSKGNLYGTTGGGGQYGYGTAFELSPVKSASK